MANSRKRSSKVRQVQKRNMSGGFIWNLDKLDKPEKPVFIILLGPTGVGKTRVLSTAYPKYQGAVKIEKDKYITDQQSYNKSIYNLVNDKTKEEIKRIIEQGSEDEKKDLTEEFNTIYGNTNVTVCYNTENTCNDYHDIKLSEKILQKRNVILEINGDKNFTWLFDKNIDSGENIENIKTILNNDYDIKLLYLSSDYKKLLESNKKRFLDGLDSCIQNDCSIRLANFLLNNIYKKSISDIFTIHKSFPISEYPNIERVYWKRENNQYIKLNNFEEYKKSFNLDDTHGGNKKSSIKKRRRHTKRRRPTRRRRR